MITIRGSVTFVVEQQKRFNTHTMTSLVRRNGEWYLTLEKMV